MPRRHPSTDRASAVFRCRRSVPRRRHLTQRRRCEAGYATHWAICRQGRPAFCVAAWSRRALPTRRCGLAHTVHPAADTAVRPSLGCGPESPEQPGPVRSATAQRRETAASEEVKVDLYEYQGRELFARHGLAGARRWRRRDPGGGPRDRRARSAAAVVVKAQVKVGGRGKAGGVKLADTADEATARATDILGMDIKGHTVHKVMITETADIAEEYYFSYLLDRANRTFLCIASVAGGMEIEQVAHEQPEKVVKAAHRRHQGRRRGARPARSWPAAGFPAEVADQVVDIAVKLWQAFVAEDATLVEVNPLAKTPRRPGALPRRQGDPGRQRRRSGTPSTRRGRTSRRWTRWSRRPRRRTSTTSSSTARSASSATAPAWSCPHWTWSPTPASRTAASSRPTSSTSAAAPRAEVMANGLEIVLSDPSVKSVFVNVFGGITACDAVANGILSALRPARPARRGGHQAAGRPAGRQQRRGGSAHPRLGGEPARRAGGHDGRCRASARPSSRRRGSDMAIWLTKDSKVIVQGMTGSEGSKHTRRMLARGHQRGRRRHTRQGRPEASTSTATPLPVFNSVGEAMAADRRRRHGHLRAAEVRQGRRDRGDRRRRSRWPS